MKANPTRPAKPSASSSAATMNALLLVASIAYLFYLWTLNYNKLASFYDYSIMVDGAGKYAAGLRPFRDFGSTLQSLPIWLARACELLFGPRYLALAYGNMILTLGLFFIVVKYARKGFSFPSAILIGIAITIASTLQHGIIWYNSIGLLLVSAISLNCADLLRSRAIRSRDAILVSGLLLLIGMTKMNFNAVAIGMVAFFALAAIIFGPRLGNVKRAIALSALAVGVCCAPPIIEVIANRTTLSTWVREVILTPASRAGDLSYLASPAFYILERNRYYPGTVLNGSVLFCFVVYGFLAYAAVEQFRRYKRGDFKGLILQLCLICLFWGSTCLLVLTNVEIESLCLCFCLVGLVGMRISGQFPGESWEKMFRASALLLAAYFLLVGSVSLARHSRIVYRGNDFVSGALPNNANPAYLRGVVLSRQAAVRLALIEDLMKKNSGVPVYWGPGVEMMNRIYGGVADPALPLWYHLNVTVRDSDAKALIDAIERSPAQLVVADKLWYPEVPAAVQKYLDRFWSLDKNYDPILVYKRKPHGQDNAGNAASH
jgi:hypothetical protein